MSLTGKEYTKLVEGEDKGDILLFALSTCGWCKKTKKELNDKEVAYHYIEVDTLAGADRDEVVNELRKWNPALNFPTVIIYGQTVAGHQPDRLKELIGK